MIKFRSVGNFKKTDDFLNRAKRGMKLTILDKYGKEGVEALTLATPVDSGETAKAWGYEIEYGTDSTTIYFTNDHIEDGANIAILLQHGHGTRYGGYVQGIDYINPAIRPVFERLAENAWKEVIRQ